MPVELVAENTFRKNQNKGLHRSHVLDPGDGQVHLLEKLHKNVLWYRMAELLFMVELQPSLKPRPVARPLLVLGLPLEREQPLVAVVLVVFVNRENP